MDTMSVWRGTAGSSAFPRLEARLETDVVVVGGGITGLTTALLLSEAGKSVVLLEAGSIGLGSTANSTGNLYAPVSDRLHVIGELWGASVMQAVADSRTQALDLIERIAVRLPGDTGFHRRDMHFYATSVGHNEVVEKEFEAARQVGLPARIVDDAATPVPSLRTLIIQNQAQFHPLAYTLALATSIESERCRVFEGSAVIAIDEDTHSVHTARGTVVARDIVLATHTPKGRFLVHAEMQPHREYGMAVRLNHGPFPQGIFWGVGPYFHSVRSLRARGVEYLICVGEDNLTGQHDATQSFLRLEAFVREHFDVASVTYRWSAQGYRAADHLPYIGRSHSSDLYVATGFSADGLTYGTVAASIIADEICGRKNAWSDVYRAGRLEPVKAAAGVVEESLSVAKAMLHDYTTRPQSPLSTIRPGEGAVVEVDGERLAAYRDASGMVTAVSPVCPHMKCIVRWNNAEKTWDCPCHGSRFDVNGNVLEGPALAPLARKAPGRPRP